MERSTRQNAAIRTALAAAGRPLSPLEVLEAARDEVAGLGQATVYRTLKALVDEGAVQVVTLPGEAARYEIADRGHHHHFRCDACQRVFDVPQCPGDLSGLAPPGFTIERHDITLYGRCADCAPAPRARTRSRGTPAHEPPHRHPDRPPHGHSHEHSPEHPHESPHGHSQAQGRAAAAKNAGAPSHRPADQLTDSTRRAPAGSRRTRRTVGEA